VQLRFLIGHAPTRLLAPDFTIVLLAEKTADR
jgi:hypothetical protein